MQHIKENHSKYSRTEEATFVKDKELTQKISLDKFCYRCSVSTCKIQVFKMRL